LCILLPVLSFRGPRALHSFPTRRSSDLLVLARDNPYNHICLVQDITERKEMEKALYESERSKSVFLSHLPGLAYRCNFDREWTIDRKSTRLNSSHVKISYAVFCLKKKQ